MKKILALMSFLLLQAPLVSADPDWEDYVGYTIIASKTIDKWIDPGKKKSGTSFEGCDYDRVIVFTDGTAVRCRTYSYSYSYRPNAILLYDGTRLVMIVNDNEYSVAPME